MLGREMFRILALLEVRWIEDELMEGESDWAANSFINRCETMWINEQTIHKVELLVGQ